MHCRGDGREEMILASMGFHANAHDHSRGGYWDAWASFWLDRSRDGVMLNRQNDPPNQRVDSGDVVRRQRRFLCHYVYDFWHSLWLVCGAEYVIGFVRGMVYMVWSVGGMVYMARSVGGMVHMARPVGGMVYMVWSMGNMVYMAWLVSRMVLTIRFVS